MSRAEPGIASSVVEPLVTALGELGYEAQAPRRPKASEEDLVAGTAADFVLNDASTKLEDPCLALTLARRIPLGSLGTLDYALCTSPTLREGLQRLARFYGVVTQRVKLSLVNEPPHAALVFKREAGIAHSRHWLEFGAAMIAERIRQTLGKSVAFDDVTFVHEAPAASATYDEFFGTRVRFGAEVDKLGFASELLELPLRTAAASLAEVLDARLRQIEPALGGEDPLISRVRRALVELMEKGDPSLEALTVRLGTSRRTLQRELQQRGKAHKEILDEVRRDKAQQLLAEGTLTVSEVASRLAFSEASAFFRAFRRWTGTSPRKAGAR